MQRDGWELNRDRVAAQERDSTARFRRTSVPNPASPLSISHALAGSGTGEAKADGSTCTPRSRSKALMNEPALPQAAATEVPTPVGAEQVNAPEPEVPVSVKEEEPELTLKRSELRL